MCIFTNDKPKTIDQCMRKASGQKESERERITHLSIVQQISIENARLMGIQTNIF